jgi:hypothetical protein
MMVTKKLREEDARHDQVGPCRETHAESQQELTSSRWGWSGCVFPVPAPQVPDVRAKRTKL